MCYLVITVNFLKKQFSGAQQKNKQTGLEVIGNENWHLSAAVEKSTEISTQRDKFSRSGLQDCNGDSFVNVNVSDLDPV